MFINVTRRKLVTENSTNRRAESRNARDKSGVSTRGVTRGVTFGVRVRVENRIQDRVGLKHNLIKQRKILFRKTLRENHT